MFRKWQEARNEEGFTLIELLVVVIIIGILAAIAIPAFLNQRERAWQSELTSAVRNAALDIEAEATAGGGDYLDDAAGIAAATLWVTSNVNGLNEDDENTGDPVSNIVYSEVTNATDVVTGFFLCMEHARIQNGENHSVTYAGGSAGNGVLGFDGDRDCAAALTVLNP